MASRSLAGILVSSKREWLHYINGYKIINRQYIKFEQRVASIYKRLAIRLAPSTFHCLKKEAFKRLYYSYFSNLSSIRTSLIVMDGDWKLNSKSSHYGLIHKEGNSSF